MRLLLLAAHSQRQAASGSRSMGSRLRPLLCITAVRGRTRGTELVGTQAAQAEHVMLQPMELLAAFMVPVQSS
jgi:hypothetical protein